MQIRQSNDHFRIFQQINLLINRYSKSKIFFKNEIWIQSPRKIIMFKLRNVKTENEFELELFLSNGDENPTMDSHNNSTTKKFQLWEYREAERFCNKIKKVFNCSRVNILKNFKPYMSPSKIKKIMKI